MTQRREQAYQALIAGLVIVGLTTFYFGHQGDVLSYLSFGSVITSIVLSVVAMVYTMSQSMIVPSNTSRLTTAADRMMEIIDELRDSQRLTFAELDRILTERLTAATAPMQEQLEAVLQSERPATGVQATGEAGGLLSRTSALGLLLILAVTLQSQRPVFTSMTDLLKGLVVEGATDDNVNYANGYFVAMQSCGVIAFEDWDKFMVQSVPDEWNEEVPQEFETRMALYRNQGNAFLIEYLMHGRAFLEKSFTATVEGEQGSEKS